MKNAFLSFVVILAVLFLTVQPSEARGWGPGAIVGATLGAAVVSSAIYYSLNPHPVYYVEAPGYYQPTVVYAQPAQVVYATPPTTYAVTQSETVVAVPPPVPAIAPAPAAVPYGFVSGSTIKSPYSSFTLSLSGHSSGSVVYDANTGSPFKVP